jgi:hypothetical protein
VQHLDSLPTGFVEIGGAMVVVAVLGLVALLSGVGRFDGLLLWALGGTTGAWLVVDHEHEIAILWSLTPNHGLTLADLAAIPSVLVALALGFRSLRAPAGTQGLTDPAQPGGFAKAAPELMRRPGTDRCAI